MSASEFVPTPSETVTTPREVLVSRREQPVSCLPKLDLPYGGPLKSLTWPTFWDSFDTAVNSNPVLGKIQLSTCAAAGRCCPSHCWTHPNQCELYTRTIITERTFWSAPQDSECTHEGPVGHTSATQFQKKLKPFVASCVQEITNSIPTSAWKY